MTKSSSPNIYKDGILDRLPVVPNLILDMKEEKHIWRLNQLTLAIHIPLSDPDYVKGIAEDMRKTRQRMAEYGAMTSLQTLKALEASVQKKTSTYTCNLTELGKGWEAVPGSETSTGRRALIQGKIMFSRLRIALHPASTLSRNRQRMARHGGRCALMMQGRHFFSDDGKGASCISSGRPVKEMEEAGSGRAMGAIHNLLPWPVALRQSQPRLCAQHHAV